MNTQNKISPKQKNKEVEYFITGLGKEAKMASSAKIAQELHSKYGNVFTGIRCFKGTFPLQVKEDVKTSGTT